MAKHLPGRHESVGFSNFKYEPLNLSSTKPSIRLAILQPGTRESAVRVTLAQTTFANRPRYEALSYTWGRPDIVKGIELNGIRVDVRENLWSALRHLRNATQERGLWIDAICINQADIEERNHQVKLMAHVYARATRVLVWLGTFSTTSPEEKSEKLTPQEANRINKTNASTICSQPYWRRVWIVQEIGVASDLVVHWSEKNMPWDELFVALRKSSPENIDLAWKLARQRQDRHGDGFLLANLIEVCKDSLCEEPRDKIYGFVGIAHDCEDDSLPMDYSKTLFEVYEDMMNFQSAITRVKSTFAKEKKGDMTREEIEGFLGMQNGSEKRSIPQVWQDEIDLIKERMKASMHFSQLIQRCLGGPAKMQEDLKKHNPKKGVPFLPPPAAQLPDLFDAFRVTAFQSGQVFSIGPFYSEIIGIPASTRRWKTELSKSDMEIKKLRKKNEGFIRVLLDLDKSDLAKVFPMDPCFSWKPQADAKEAPNLNQLLRAVSELNKLPKFKFGPERPLSPEKLGGPDEATDQLDEPRLFLTKSGVIGLMPSNARAGDMVYQFWRSDAVAIVRKEDDYLRIVGRAVVANESFVEGSKFYEPEDYVDGLSFTAYGKEVYMDMRTMQLMTQ